MVTASPTTMKGQNIDQREREGLGEGEGERERERENSGKSNEPNPNDKLRNVLNDLLAGRDRISPADFV